MRLSSHLRQGLLPRSLSGSAALFKNTGYLTLSTMIDRATSLVLTLLIARVLGVSDLGVYASALAFYNLVFAGAELGLVNFLTREIARNPERTNSYIIHSCVLASVCSFIVIGGSLVVVRFLGYSAKLTESISIIVFALLPAVLNAIQVAVLVAYQKLRYQAYASAIAAVVNLGAGIVLVERGAGVISLLILFVVVRCVLVVFYFSILNTSVSRLHWELDRHEMRRLIHDIRTFTGIAILAAAFTQPEVIILSIVTTTRQVGLYSAALRIVELVNEVARIFLTNVFPELSRAFAAGRERFEELRQYASHILLAVALPAAALLVVVAEPLLKLLYGPKFAAATTTLRILAVGIPLLAVWSVLWRVLAARYQQGLVLRVQVISVIARIGIGFALAALWGTVGASIALVVAFAVLTVQLVRYVQEGDEGSALDVVKGTSRYAIGAAAMIAIGLPLVDRLGMWGVVPVCVAVYVAIAAGSLPLRRRLDERRARTATPGT